MSAQRGFTLLEMLAALAVLALCASVLLGAFGQSARALQQSARSERLSMAALSIMADLDAGPLVAGEREGQWENVRWHCSIAAVAALAGPSQLLQLDLTVEEGARQARLRTQRVRSMGSEL